jgi:hypothetical protein
MKPVLTLLEASLIRVFAIKGVTLTDSENPSYS